MNEIRKSEVQNKILEIIKKRNSNTLNFAIPNHFAKKALSFNSIRDDLMFARNTAIELYNFKRKRFHFISQTRQITISGSLWYTIISLYGKCFTDASQASQSKLEVRDCFLGTNNPFLLTHNKIMELRHNYIAHRGDTHNEQGIMILKYQKKSTDKAYNYTFKSTKSYSISIKDLEEYLILLDYLINHIQDKLRKQIDRINSKMSELEIEELYKLIIK